MQGPLAPFTVAVAIITALFSLQGFRDPAFVEKFIFVPERILRDKQGYRLITSGFLHADWFHLIFNMYSFCSFGKNIEFIYGPATLMVIYFSSIVGGDLHSLFLHRHHEYRSYGASGGVCGVIFASLFLVGGGVTPLLCPFTIPGWLYAILFLVGSFMGIKRARDNIGHDAHLGGAIIGLLVTTALEPRIVFLRPAMFATVMGLSLVLLVYLVRNPLFLPLSAFHDWLPQRSEPRKSRPEPEDDSTQVDAILEKVSRSGIQSLSKAEHKKLLDASRKKGPGGGLRR